MFTTDDVLSKLGLQARASTGDYLLPLLGVFGAGMIVGAGVALLLAPKSGAMLREDLGRKAMDIKDKVKRVVPRASRRVREFVDVLDDDLETMTREELYERATEQNIPHRAEMSKPELIDALRSSS